MIGRNARPPVMIVLVVTTGLVIAACAPWNLTSTGGGGAPPESGSSAAKAVITSVNSKLPDVGKAADNIERNANDLGTMSANAAEAAAAVGTLKSLESDLSLLQAQADAVSTELSSLQGKPVSAEESEYQAKVQSGVDAARSGQAVGAKAVARTRSFLQIMVPVLRALQEFSKASAATGAKRWGRAEAHFKNTKRLIAQGQRGLVRFVDRNKLPDTKRALSQLKVVTGHGIAALRALRRGDTSAAITAANKMSAANRKLGKLHIESELDEYSNFLDSRWKKAVEYLRQASSDFEEAQQLYRTKLDSGR